MTVGIQSTAKNAYLPNAIRKIAFLENGAITTSGNYQKYYESKGEKLSHLINLKTEYTV